MVLHSTFLLVGLCHQTGGQNGPPRKFDGKGLVFGHRWAAAMLILSDHEILISTLVLLYLLLRNYLFLWHVVVQLRYC